MTMPYFQTSLFQAGRIHLFWQAWMQMRPSKFVQQVIQNGLRLFIDKSKILHKMRSNAANLSQQMKDYAWKEVQQELQWKCIKQVTPQQAKLILPIFYVPKPDGSFRRVFDARALNNAIQCPSFKMDHPLRIARFVRIGMKAAKTDIFKGYYHVKVADQDSPYLCFKLEDLIFQYKVLPFGVNIAPRVFTKLMKPCITLMRKEGHLAFSYIDDFLMLPFGTSMQQVLRNLEILQSVGWIGSPEKTIWQPVDEIEYVGWMWNFVLGLIFLPKNKKILYVNLSKEVLVCRQVGYKFMERWVGKLVYASSMIPMIRPYVWILQRKLQWMRQHNVIQDNIVDMECQCIQKIIYWIQTYRGLPFEMDSVFLMVATDASDLGGGGVFLDKAVQFHWNDTERDLHITEKEALAVLFVLREVEKYLELENVQFHLVTDAEWLKPSLQKGYSRGSKRINNIILQIYQLLEPYQAVIRKVSYIPSKDNVEADYLSRMKQTMSMQDWRLSKDSFSTVSQRFGPFTVDRFATYENKRLPKFCSIQHTVEQFCSNDALLQEWKMDNNYWCPPLGLIETTVLLIAKQRASGTIILPVWHSAAWWPILLAIAKDWIYLERSDLLGLPNCEIYRNQEWKFAAVQVEGSKYWL